MDKNILFMIDPPWPISMGGKRKARATLAEKLPYETMSYEQIERTIEKLTDEYENCTLFLWATERTLKEAESLLDCKCFKMHQRLIWDKGNGFPAAFTIRPCHEYLIWAYRGKFQGVEKSVRGKFSSVIREASREHSRKPNAAYELIEKLYPDFEKWDIFSRQIREGWLQFGDQCEHFK